MMTRTLLLVSAFLAAPLADGSALAGAPSTPLGPRSGQPAVAPHRFDVSAQQTMASFLDTLEHQLATFLRADDDAAAKRRLVDRAYKPTPFGTRLAAFKDKATSFGATRVKFNGFEVRATLWHQRIPMKDVEIYFWRVGTSSFQILRLMTDRTFHTFFAGPEIVAHRGAPANAAGALAQEVVELIRRGRCEAVPTVLPKHLEPFVPKLDKARKQTLFQFHKYRFRTKTQCRSAQHLPFTHLTFRVGDVGGVLLDQSGERYSFKIGLAARRDERRSLGLLSIIDPIPPSRHEPRGMKLKFRKARQGNAGVPATPRP